MEKKEFYPDIPLPTVRRMPAYLKVLKEMESEGETWASAAVMAEKLDLKAIQIRKDLACTGVNGKPKRGFQIKPLMEAINRILKGGNDSDVLLLGVGHLGSALLGYKGFNRYELEIVSAFDTDPKLHGKKIHGITVESVEKVGAVVAEKKIQTAILTVPGDKAQEAADLLIDAGIEGIWNFTPINIKVPDHVVVRKEDLALSLAMLFAELNSRERPEKR